MSQTLTKAYISTSGGSAQNLSLTAKGSWDATASATIHPATPRPNNTSISTTTKTETNATNPWRVLMAFFVTDPLAAVTGYTGTLDIVLGLLESSASANFFTSLHVWLSVGDTDVVRATLIDNYSEDTTNEWPTTAAGVALQLAQSIASVDITEGDRIVVEFGFAARNGVTTSFTGTLRRGNISGNADLTAGSTSVTTLNGYVVFDPGLDLAAPSNDLATTPVVVDQASLPYSVTGVKQKYATGASGSGGAQRDPFIDINEFFSVDHTLFWKIVPDSNFTANIYVDGSDGPVRVAVFNLDEATLLTSSADGGDSGNALNPSSGSPLAINMIAGQTYYIMAGYDQADPAWGTVGLLNLHIDDAGGGGPTPPANNTCADAQDIASLPFTDTVDTTGDTAVDGSDPSVEALGATAPKNTVFYTYTPAEDQYVTFSFEGSTPDAFVAIYTGSCGTLTEVASISDLTGSSKTVKLTGSTTYTIMYGSRTSGGGSLSVSITELSNVLPVQAGEEFVVGFKARGPERAMSTGAPTENFLLILRGVEVGSGSFVPTNTFAVVEVIFEGSSFSGGAYTQFDWRPRLRYTDRNGDETIIDGTLTPYVSSIIGTTGDNSGNLRTEWGWHDWAMKVRMASFDPNTNIIQDDGHIGLYLDGVLMCEADNISFLEYLVQNFVNLVIVARLDCDAPYIVMGSNVPTEFNSNGSPVSDSMVFFDPMDASFTGWRPYDYSGLASSGPYANSKAGFEGVGYSGLNDDPSVPGPVNPTTTDPLRLFGALERTLQLSITALNAANVVNFIDPRVPFEAPPVCDTVLRRLGDPDERIWTDSEIDTYLQLAVKEMCTRTRLIWDWVYPDDFPRGFSYTSAFELTEIDLGYSPLIWKYGQGDGMGDGQGNYTADFERREWLTIPEGAETGADEEIREGFARHTFPDEIEWLVDLGSAQQQGTADLPHRLTELERSCWDFRWIEADSHENRRYGDSRYETQEGEVESYTWRKDGPRTFRKIRVPAAVAYYYVIDGLWGIARDLDDLDFVGANYDGYSGAWGIPRQIPGEHPIGPRQTYSFWGTPRHFHREGRNVRVEHWRTAYFDCLDSELPERYRKYLQWYAMWRALSRKGPGQDLKLAGWYRSRWEAGLKRIVERINRQNSQKTYRAGGGQRPENGPPRPRLPWQYGSRLR